MPKRVRSEEYYENNRINNRKRYHDKYKKREDHRRNAYRYTILWKYGLTEDAYHAMYLEQGGLCLVCSMPIRNGFEDGPKKKAAHVDHCHTTNKVRGLLCHFCNVGLGSFKDNKELLSKAIEYLNARSG